MNEFLQHALQYARRGWSVIPLRAKDKKPALASWKEYQSRRASEDEIREWWTRWPDANIGIATGAVSGIIVLDVDGEDGRRSLEEIAGGNIPRTPHTNTGKGRHYLFRHPGGEWRNFAGKLPGLDFRGDGGYIVAPPSVHPSGRRYEWELGPDEAELADPPAWLMELLTKKPDPPQATGCEPKPVTRPPVSAGADVILANCAFCQHCRDNAETLSEPEWYAMISNLARADGGRELIHELSRPYPRYSPAETERKIEHALRDGEPHTCAYIQDSLGFTGCPAAGCGVKAPIGFVSSPLVLAKITVDSAIRELRREPKRETIYDDEVIGALAVLRQRDATEYARAKGEIKDAAGRLVSIPDLERAVKQKQAAQQNMRVVQPGEEAPPIKADWLENKPFPFEIRKFGDWMINENGIAKVVFTDEGPNYIQVCSAPLFITKRLKRVDSGLDEARVELSWWRDNEWQRAIVDADVAFTSSKATILRKMDVPINSETSKHFVSYLQEFERTYIQEIPLVKTVSRMGWYGSKHFFPGLEGDYIVDNPDMAKQLAGFHEAGTLEDWVTFITPIRKYPIARFMLACSFAAPLMRLVNQRIFIFHVYGRSRGGKTASMVAALSVWGRPEDIMANFNTTKVGIEQLAGFYNDLPIGIDEQQVAARNQSFIESLVYMLSMGKGRTRGSKGGGIREYQQWKTIVLTTGEDPISTDSSTAGVKSRALEVYGSPIPDELAAQRIHRGIVYHYGTAGVAFIRRLMDELSKDPKMVLTGYEQFLDALQKKFPDNLSSHVSAVTIAMLADFYASQWIFGLDETTAFIETVKMGEEILGMLEKSSEADDALRAYEYITSWADANSAAFSDTIQNVWYGKKTDDWLYIFPVVFEKAMKEGGFNPKRILKDWAQTGVIKTEILGGKVRNTVREYVKMSHNEYAKSERKNFVAIKRATFKDSSDELFK